MSTDHCFGVRAVAEHARSDSSEPVRQWIHMSGRETAVSLTLLLTPGQECPGLPLHCALNTIYKKTQRKIIDWNVCSIVQWFIMKTRFRPAQNDPYPLPPTPSPPQRIDFVSRILKTKGTKETKSLIDLM